MVLRIFDEAIVTRFTEAGKRAEGVKLFHASVLEARLCRQGNSARLECST